VFIATTSNKSTPPAQEIKFRNVLLLEVSSGKVRNGNAPRCDIEKYK
jgi:hypothetical protein